MELTLTIQGYFYIATGVWPIVHMRSFEAVSGLKVDKWLVKTVGLLLTCSGIIFVSFSHEKAALWLAIMNATCLIAIDVYYVWRKVILKVYLLDAIVEAVFILAYVFQRG